MKEKRVKCAKCGHEFGGLQIRKCLYSRRGLHVCVYCCKKCPYVKPYGTGWICTYQKDKEKTKLEKYYSEVKLEKKERKLDW